MYMDPNAPHRSLDLKDIAFTTIDPITLCGTKLVTVAVKNTRVENIAIGGIINIGGPRGNFYATTSGMAIRDVRHPFHMQYSSERNLDWGLCEINTPELMVPNRYNLHPLLGYMNRGGAQNLNGSVEVFIRNGVTHEGYFSSDYDDPPPRPNEPKKHGILLSLQESIEVPNGVWVVKDNLLCGYVVHTWYVDGVGRACHMIPIWHALEEVEEKTGESVFFGQELHDMMRDRRGI